MKTRQEFRAQSSRVAQASRLPAGGGNERQARPLRYTEPLNSELGTRNSEGGFTLAALLVILTVLGVFIAYTVVPMWSVVQQRDRELQTIFAMKQYARAIREFQRRRQTYPVSLEQLKEQNNPRVLRALYPNPLSGKVDWVPIPFGATAAGPAPQGAASTQPSTPLPQSPTVGATGKFVGPFIGVRPPTPGQSIITFRGSNRYREWFYSVTEIDGTRPAIPGQIGAPGYGNNPIPGSGRP